jgi:hypothetical protein
MKTCSSLFALCLVLAFGAVAMTSAAEEVTKSGTIACAKCVLKKDGAKECQDVLVVKEDGGTTTEYYITKNDAAKEFGHGCSSEKSATVTGVVSEKDGRMWITASKIQAGS